MHLCAYKYIYLSMDSGCNINATFITDYSVFLGTSRMYIIADLDLFKEITVKQHDKFMDRMVGEIPFTFPHTYTYKPLSLLPRLVPITSILTLS